MKKGIDVSQHQGGIDWKKVRSSGIDFAIIRAGYGKTAAQKDAMFEKNYAGCMAAQMPCGAYWYSYALSESEAVQEAKACLAVICGKQFAYPIYFDIEEKNRLNSAKLRAV